MANDRPHQPAIPPSSRQRPKPQLSCGPCRHRKLRCDRQQPCGACSRRHIPESCHYATTRALSSAMQRPGTPQQSSLYSRISDLENLVTSLMEGESRSTSSVSSEGTLPWIQAPKTLHHESSSADAGTLWLRESGVGYVQSAHWKAILSKIKGLKEDFMTDNKPQFGSRLFYGLDQHATRDDLLAAVPARSAVDRLMALHFDSYFVAAYILHADKFSREYENFWKDSSSASTAWIGLLFSMLYIAAQLQMFNLDLNDQHSASLKAECFTMKDVFREKAIQSLILARYTTGGPHILETLIMILTGEFILTKDGGSDGWLSISVILNIAMRMGFHRDPSHFPGVSLFEGEMRRRIWLTILQLDISLSLERGLPRNATDAYIDTREPRNLRDCDISEGMTEMPSSKPDTEWTPVLPLITRGRLITALGLICDINADTNPPSHDQILKIDALLEDVHSRAIPSVLRWKSAITDSANLVVQRVSVETTYYKSRILLHRRALILNPARQSSENNRYSARICLEAALKILGFQQMLYDESQPLGRLYQLRWKVKHIFDQDILLATSVLCLYLQNTDELQSMEAAAQTPSLLSTDHIRSQLLISHSIWRALAVTSIEAQKVAKALSIVLGNPEESIDEGGGPGAAQEDFIPDDLLTDFDTMPSSMMFNNQYLPSGFYDPLAFFDSVLDNNGA